MTSKEALKETKQIIINNAKKGFIKDYVILDNNLNIIEKDINEIMDYIKDLKEENRKQKEILEILKPRIYIEEGLYREDFQDDRLRFGKDFFDSAEQENTIKEWLEK